jgi:hypothetical protein
MSNHKSSPPSGAAPSQSELAAIAARIAAEAAGKVDIASVWPGRAAVCVRRPIAPRRRVA